MGEQHFDGDATSGDIHPRVSSPLRDMAVVRSTLAPEAVLEAVQREYRIDRVEECILIRTFVNDVYLLTGLGSRYVFKVYRPGWRDVPALLWETDLLVHLARQGVPVAPAISRKDDRMITAFAAPEGIRHGIAFAYAVGAKPQPPFTADLYHHFGRAAGLIHQRSNGFVSPYSRQALDLAELIDRPLEACRHFLARRQEDWDYMLALAEKLRRGIMSLAQAGLDWGVCHQDMTLDNLHVAENGDITIYDFDSGGPGWRSLDFQGIYDYALYNQNDHWDAFVHGYTEIRQLSRADLAAIPYFVLTYAFWAMYMDIFRSRWAGVSYLDEEYFDGRMGRQGWWRRWEDEHLPTRQNSSG